MSDNYIGEKINTQIRPFPSHPYEGKYVLVRSYGSGVHAGILKEYDPYTCHIYLTDTRRIWYWEKAFTLSAVQVNGIGGDSKLSLVSPELMITQVEEIGKCTPESEKCLREWPVHTPN